MAPPPDQTAADPSAAVPTGRPGEYRDPATGTVYLAPSTVYPASDDPMEQLRFETGLHLSALGRTVESDVAAKAASSGVQIPNLAARAGRDVETEIASRNAQHPAVAEMAAALAGWEG